MRAGVGVRSSLPVLVPMAWTIGSASSSSLGGGERTVSGEGRTLGGGAVGEVAAEAMGDRRVEVSAPCAPGGLARRCASSEGRLREMPDAGRGLAVVGVGGDSGEHGAGAKKGDEGACDVARGGVAAGRGKPDSAARERLASRAEPAE